jgi:hypothetical protein
MGSAQQAQVLRDGWAGDREGTGDLPSGLCAAAQKIENRAACRISQGLESGLIVPCFGICNQSVTHNA